MAKQGMKRPDVTHTHPKNELAPVPEIQGKAKSGKEKAKPAMTAKKEPHHSHSSPYDVFDNDVAKENLENDLSAADLQDS